jgi:hypothetical protein
VHPGLLDMLHDAANNNLLAIAYRIHVDLYRLIEKAIE